MHYFIDGYNLLFRVVKADKNEDLQQQRERVIEDLSIKIKLLKIDATIVFDSYYQKGFRERTVFHTLEVLFTDEKETADECILDELKKRSNLRVETVVTSDKKLAWHARVRGAHSQTVEEFLKALNQRYKKKQEKPLLVKPPLKKMVRLRKEGDLQEYYLKAFETLEKQEGKDRKAAVSKPSKENAIPTEEERYLDIFGGKKEASKIKGKNARNLSDFERWLKAFEEEAGEPD